ncbi:MAG: bifunctional methylenetetrahydrofolate dehydrogenase/methenyltetrahydrofolate cyclohydrolase FolD [Thermoplasmata archaeon]
MTAQIISGKELSKEIRAELKDEVEQLKKKGITPGLAVILVGEDPASQVYVRNKGKACEKLGIHEVTETLPADTSEEDLLALVEKFNKDPTFHGILVQLPLPKHIDESKVLYAIDPTKDVDGFHPVNVGKLMIGDPYFLPCTPHGIQEMLLRSGNDPARKHVVVVGRSNIVGKPIANILLQKKEGANATVTICHTGTDDIAKFTREADIIIAATGWPNTVTADMVKDGVVVIDVGVNRVDDPSKKRGYRLVGDVDFEGIKEKAAAISPVPGGVGPMTITMLMKNTVRAAKLAHGIED